MTPTYANMIRVFGRIGLLSFGGPAAQIALMHKELVEDRPWLDEDTYLRALSLCMLLPGPEAMQLATYAGWRLRGTPGGLIGGGLFVLPGAVVIAGLVWLYVALGDVPLVQSMFLGVQAVVIVIVLQALRGLAHRALKTPTDWGLAGLAFLAIFALNLPFPLIIAAAGLCGWVTANAAQTVLPVPSRTPSRHHPLHVLAIWGGLWLTPLMAISATGPEILARIGWFFAWLAVVTFGGAYAVLAYMTQIVVSDFGWLDTAQMIDALGLAETTPGPLILVTQFVAMLTGFQSGGVSLAVAAGLVALWATFVPCFLWIFLTAPYVESLAGRPRLAAALRAITAAVVGIILNLSVWFALHVVFDTVTVAPIGFVHLPIPTLGSLNPLAVALTILAGVSGFVMKQSMVRILAICAVAAAASALIT